MDTDLKTAQRLLRKLEDIRVLYFIDLNSLSWQRRGATESHLRLVIDLIAVNASLILFAEQRLARLTEEARRVRSGNGRASAGFTPFQRHAERN